MHTYVYIYIYVCMMFYLKFEKYTIPECNRISNIYITVIPTIEQNRVIRLNESKLNNKYESKLTDKKRGTINIDHNSLIYLKFCPLAIGAAIGEHPNATMHRSFRDHSCFYTAEGLRVRLILDFYTAACCSSRHRSRISINLSRDNKRSV